MLVISPFICRGKYCDADDGGCPELRFLSTENHTAQAAFKTPGLRGVSTRALYMRRGADPNPRGCHRALRYGTRRVGGAQRTPTARTVQRRKGGASGISEHARPRTMTRSLPQGLSGAVTGASPSLGSGIRGSCRLSVGVGGISHARLTWSSLHRMRPASFRPGTNRSPCGAIS